jgi:hypothetical protein
MGQVTLSSWMGMPCTSNARPHSLHRPGGAVWWLHASELWVHSVHSLITHDLPCYEITPPDVPPAVVGNPPTADAPEDAVGDAA